jgi:hypothetical protein
MQYIEVSRVVKNIISNCSSMEFSILNFLLMGVEIKAATKADAKTRNIKPIPDFCIVIPRLVVNFSLSLSKVRGQLYFISIIVPMKITKKIIVPKGCGIIFPSDKAIKNNWENIKFQKLSLLSLALIKLRIRLSHFIFNHYLNFSTYLLMLVGFSKYLQNFIKVEEVF